MFAKGLAVFAFLALMGCTTARITGYDHRFKPLSDGTFEYEAVAGPFYPPKSASAEANRLLRLKLYLTDNDLCPGGYEVFERIAIREYGSDALAHRIHYRVRCKEGNR